MRSSVRGWHALLWMGGVFALVQILSGIALDQLIAQVRFPLVQKHLRNLNQVPTFPEIVAIGSSRLGCSLDDRLATAHLRAVTSDPQVRVYNGAIAGSDPCGWELLIEPILARSNLPRLLVIEVMPETVSDRSHCVWFAIQRQLTWANWPDHWPALVATKNLPRFVTSRCLPLLFHRHRIAEALVEVMQAEPPCECFSPTCWTQQIVGDPHLPATQRLRRGIGRLDIELDDYAPRGPYRQALERILTRCQEAAVPVVLLGVPVASTNREKYTPTVEAVYRDYLAELCERFGVTVRDLRDAVPDEDFADHNHLLPTGTLRFTPMLVERVLAPVWRTRR